MTVQFCKQHHIDTVFSADMFLQSSRSSFYFLFCCSDLSVEIKSFSKHYFLRIFLLGCFFKPFSLVETFTLSFYSIFWVVTLVYGLKWTCGPGKMLTLWISAKLHVEKSALQPFCWVFVLCPHRSTPSTSSSLRRGTTAGWSSTAPWSCSCSTATWWAKSGFPTPSSEIPGNRTLTGSRLQTGCWGCGATAGSCTRWGGAPGSRCSSPSSSECLSVFWASGCQRWHL